MPWFRGCSYLGYEPKAPVISCLGHWLAAPPKINPTNLKPMIESDREAIGQSEPGFHTQDNDAI